MKKYFYLLLFISSFIKTETEPVDIIKHINALSQVNANNNTVITLARKQLKLLKVLKQKRITQNKELQTIVISIEEIKTKISDTKNTTEQEALQEIEQIFNKVALQKKLDSLIDDFVNKIELSLENITATFSIKGLQQLATIIVNNEKLITQLTTQKDIFTFTQSSKSADLTQLYNLKSKLRNLQVKKHELIHSFIESLKKDLSLLNKQMQPDTVSNSSYKQPSRFTTPSISQLKKKNNDSSSFFKIGAASLLSLIGGTSLYKYFTRKNNLKKEEEKKEEKEENEQANFQTFVKIPKENFSCYEGPIPPEIKNIFDQLKTNNPQQILTSKAPILVGPGKNFLTKCLAGELKAPFLSISSSSVTNLLLQGQNPISALKKLIILIRKKARQTNTNAGILLIEQVDDIIENQSEEIPEEIRVLLFQKLLKIIKSIQENDSKVTIITTMSSLTSTSFIDESSGFRFIKIPLPDEQTRKNFFEKENLKTQNIENFVSATNGMKVSELKSIVQELKNSKEKESSAIKNLVDRKKNKKRKILERKIEGCSFPELSLEEYIGEIPRQLLNYIESIQTNNDEAPIKKFFLSAPDGSGRKYLAQCIAGQFGAPLYEISLEDIIKSDNLQTSISKIQEISHEAQSKMAVIYIKEDIDLFLEENALHSINEDAQKISNHQKRMIRKFIEQISNINNSDNTLSKVLFFCPLQITKENLKKAAKKEKESMESFLLDKLIGPETFDDILGFSFIEENDRKKAWKKALKEGGDYEKEVNIDDLAKKSEGLSPGRIKKIIHEAKNITEKNGENEISLKNILLAGENQLQPDEVNEEVDPKELQNFSFDFPNFKGTIPEPIKLAYLQLKFRNYFEEKGIKAPTGILICGEPGNGKTMVMKEMVAGLNCYSVTFDCSETAQKYKGEGIKKYNKAVREVQTLQQLYPYATAICFKFNEGEGIFKKVDLTNENSASDVNLRGKVLNTFEDFDSHAEERAILKMLMKKVKGELNQEDLQQLEKQLKKIDINLNLNKQLPRKLPINMQKIIVKKFKLKLRELGPPVVALVSTNYKPSQLDSASIRPGRINYIAFFDFPDEKSRKDILHYWLRHQQLAKDLNLNKLVSQLKRKTSGADLKFIAEQAALKASIENQAINNNHLQHAVDRLKEEQKNRRR